MKFLKLISVFLALTLTVSMALPAAAADSVEIVASGQCGENVYWKLDEDGLLLITGNGPMYNFSSGFPAPWAYLYGSICVVFLSNGITTIGSNTFWCPNPFGQFTFANITIPRSVSYIDPTAFRSCPYLQGVYFGDTYDRWVALIENTQEELLQSIILHASDGDVNMCGIYTHWKYNDGTLTISGNGPMMDWSMSSYTPWHLSLDSLYATKIVVEQGVTHVGNWAFHGSWAKELVLADSVVSVGNHAFQGCDFETVHLGSNLIWIGESAFEDCDSLRTVTLPSTLIATGPFAFRGCTKLLAANLGGLTTLSQEVFSSSSNLIAVHIPSSVSTMEWGAFYKSGLRHVFYEGTAAQLQQIYDEGGNEVVASGTIQYNTDMGTAAYYLENIHLLCDHDYGDWTNGGPTHNRICQNCNYTDAVEHSWDEGRVTTKPTCRYMGTTTYKCTTCNATKEEDIEKTAHTFGDYCVDSSGKHKRTCTFCFYDEIGGEHIWDEGKLVREPSCKVYGIYQYNCTICPSGKSIAIDKLTTHTYSSANDTQCDICGYERDLPSGGDETTSHTWNSGTITKKATCKEEGVKTYSCTVCNATKTESIAKLTTHTYDHACDTDCNVCGVTRTTTHNYKTTWSSDKTNHWHECSVCKDKKDVAAHTPGAEATETKAQTCTTCGYVIKAALGHKHNYATTWTTDDAGHWYACSGCAEKGSYAAHDFENACDKDCSVCGFTRETEHKFAETWTTDANNHWHVCSGCGLKQDEAAHEPGAEATATTAQTCTICGYEIAPALGEETTAPSEGTDETAPTTPVVQGDSNNEFPVWVVIVIAVVAIGGVVAFIVIKKKKS